MLGIMLAALMPVRFQWQNEYSVDVFFTGIAFKINVDVLVH
jgi:hypothetical protein